MANMATALAFRRSSFGRRSSFSFRRSSFSFRRRGLGAAEALVRASFGGTSLGGTSFVGTFRGISSFRALERRTLGRLGATGSFALETSSFAFALETISFAFALETTLRRRWWRWTWVWGARSPPEWIINFRSTIVAACASSYRSGIHEQT